MNNRLITIILVLMCVTASVVVYLAASKMVKEETRPVQTSSITGVIKDVTITALPNHPTHQLITIYFDDGLRVHSLDGIPDIVKIGAKNRIKYKRISHSRGYYNYLESVEILDDKGEKLETN
jgi:hypothetical protein